MAKKTASKNLAEIRKSAEKRKRRSAQARSDSNSSVEVRPSERLSGSATTADKVFARRDFLVRFLSIKNERERILRVLKTK